MQLQRRSLPESPKKATGESMTSFGDSSHKHVSEKTLFESLILARKENDLEAQALILDGFRPFLTQLASQLIGRKYLNRLEVSDLVQCAVIGAFNDFPSCRAANEVEFKAWLRRLLINDTMNQVRFLKQTKRDIGRELPDSDLAKIADSQLPPDAIVAKEEDVNRLVSVMEKLSEKDQRVIRLRSQENLKFAEIGTLMDRSEDSARMLWVRAIKKLAKLLGNNC